MTRWTPMQQSDLAAVKILSEATYPNHPEDAPVYIERLALYAQGCFVSKDAKGLAGYAITHPWKHDAAPALNSTLGGLPPDCDTYYIHDIALRADTHGSGLGREIVEHIKHHAKAAGFRTVNLVAVNGSRDFWRSRDFAIRDVPALKEKLLSYDQAAVYMEYAVR